MHFGAQWGAVHPLATREGERERTRELPHSPYSLKAVDHLENSQKMSLNDLKFRAGHEENFKYAQTFCITEAPKITVQISPCSCVEADSSSSVNFWPFTLNRIFFVYLRELSPLYSVHTRTITIIFSPHKNYHHYI